MGSTGTNPGEFGAVLAIIGLLFGVCWAIFWMVVGWRAMTAHERLADAHQRLAKTIAEKAIQDGKRSA